MDSQSEFIELINQKSPGAKPLLIVIRGSQAYGTSLPTSDTDYAGVYIQSKADIYGTRYREQINDDKNDTVFYELRRFLELVATNNPTIMELLNTPEDCIIYKHPLFDLILEQRDLFITKNCAKSFGGYAIQQIKKAKGQDKKQNWEKSKIERKDVLDFCYVIDNERSIPWKEWNLGNNFDEKFLGVVSIPNARDLYAVYHDHVAYECFSEILPNEARASNLKRHKEYGRPTGLGYKGLVKVGEGSDYSQSNQLRLSSVERGHSPIAIIFYNKDGYTQHCKDYKSYQEWLTNRNQQRWVDVKSHDQKIDGKNMMHCHRLLEMAREIGEGQGIIVRRPNREYLLSIRRGEVDLQSLIDRAESSITEIDRIFESSDLPDSVDPKLIHELLVRIRTEFYEPNNVSFVTKIKSTTTDKIEPLGHA
jgi:hypothetical protein